ncbi:PP2C family protein-serine/threonine phosphatase [Streptomyces avermitilis]|uniref:PP2C family protein-serine/threonine phosphatase n=1 Tax=Streptomyces avermitilis TaxID=33903 RepID=UPI0036A2C0E4
MNGGRLDGGTPVAARASSCRRGSSVVGCQDDGAGNDLPATCACAVYDGVTGDLRLALAGHPPPLLVRPDGSADILAADPGPPGGMGLDHVYEDAHHLVPSGSLLVLYTDGMIEDRSTFLDLEQGIAMLRRAVHNTEASLDEVCVALMAARPANSADDATLFVTRRTRIQSVTVANRDAVVPPSAWCPLCDRCATGGRPWR